MAAILVFMGIATDPTLWPAFYRYASTALVAAAASFFIYRSKPGWLVCSLSGLVLLGLALGIPA